MSVYFLTIVLASQLPPAAVQKEDLLKRELNRIQGTWKLVSIESSGRKTSYESGNESWCLKVKGNSYILTIERNGKEVSRTQGPFKCDPSQMPKTVDFTYFFGAQQFPFAGIYELEGDRVKLCFPNRSGQPRPKELATKKDSGEVLMIWERERL
jgi:uncharacterized protein (TIGR03067 family)